MQLDFRYEGLTSDVSVYTGDLTCDGVDEIITIDNNGQAFKRGRGLTSSNINFRTLYSNQIQKIEFKHDIGKQYMKDKVINQFIGIEKEGKKDFVISHKERDSVFLLIMSPEKKIESLYLYDYSTFKHRYDYWITRIVNPRLFRDNFILFIAQTYYDYYPRGIFCLDTEDRKIEWRFETPGNCTNYEFTDEGILLASSASNNGKSIRNESDSDGWLYLLDNNGKLQWKMNLGEGGFLNIIDIIDNKALIQVRYCSGHNINNGFLALINNSSGTIIKKLGFRNMGNIDCSCFPFYENGRKYYRILAYKNKLITLDKNLEIKYEWNIKEGQWFYLLTDFPRRKAMTTAVIGVDFQAYFYDKSGNLFCILPDVYRVEKIQDVKNYNKALIVGFKSAGIYSFIKGKNPLYAILSILGGIAGLLFIGFLLIKLIIYIKIHNIIMKEGSSYVIITDSKGVIISDNSNIENEYENVKISKGLRFLNAIENTPFEILSYPYMKAFNEDINIVDNVTLDIGITEEFYILKVTPIKLFGRTVLFLILMNNISDIIRSKKYEALFAFSRIISHNIKNPLSSISMVIDRFKKILLDNIKDENVIKRLNEYRRITETEIRRIKDLSNSILKLSYGDLMKKEPIEINTLIKEIVKKYYKRGRGEIKSELYNEEIIILGDSNLLKLAVQNVIDNSIEASEEMYCIEIKTKKSDSRGIIEVKDSGSGISSEEIMRIFNPFYTTKKTGRGLGLYLTKDIIKKHNGYINAKSKEADGTTITMEFKLC